MNKQLFIIGNGFDIFHGIPSRYSDFEAYVKASNPSLYAALQEYFVQDELWSDFEATLALIDTDKIVEDAAQYLDDYGAEDWSDAGHHNYQYEMQRAIDLVTVDLRNAFIAWILDLEIPSEGKLLLPEDATYLLFNYTKTLQLCYSIPEDRILYIHNKAVNLESEIILGHSRELSAEESFSNYKSDGEMEDYDVRVMEGNVILDNYFKNTYKDTPTIISENENFFRSLSNIDEIIVLGHSLSAVDLPYFERIVDFVSPDCKWKVSYFGDKDKPVGILKSIGIPERNITPIKIEELQR
ncbi:bacteriophage abortive infection AbiH family protein [Flavobacterium sp. WW92]|uniref:bacteriophage abortive infection AbiH family protein n=1 Tax=unclassified Flavobacterium TaxID=196869 RepID=UPI002224523C|nr:MULTISPECIES: bacteriophage abortive infection AbiH family protein [unclassified Flavobacterium]WDO12332.1 bacteriophage abortive infection AbiH family protein [Flavobacterium sp. WW92]